jgi:hypothetical protein
VATCTPVAVRAVRFDEARARREAPAQLVEGQLVAAEDPCLRRGRDQVGAVPGGRDAMDAAVAELVAQLRRRQRVEVVVVREDERVGDLLELRFPAGRVDDHPPAVGDEPGRACGALLIGDPGPQSHADAGVA